MATFNFAKAIKTVKTEEELEKHAVKKGVRFAFDNKAKTPIGWKFENLGVAENVFIEKGVLAWFNSCDFGNALCDHDTEIMEMVALTALFRAHKPFEKLDGS